MLEEPCAKRFARKVREEIRLKKEFVYVLLLRVVLELVSLPYISVNFILSIF